MSESRQPSHNRRWYDQIDQMTMAVHISRELPSEIQALIARSLNEAIDTNRRNRRTDKSAISIGYSRMLGLYKASNGRRWYDPNPLTSRAFNFMSTVPDSYLAELAGRILVVGQYVEQQRQGLPVVSNRLSLTGQVQGILRDGQVESIRQGENGIRLVREFLTESSEAGLRSR